VLHDAEEPSLPTPVDSGLLDAERIAALSHIGGSGSDFLSGYVDAAFEDITAAVAEVQAGFAQREERTVRDGLHKIDGTAASIGATALLATSKRVRDHLTAAPGDPGLELALAELAGVCALTKSRLQTLVSEKQALR
jgi:HPt (histidine-containing phosphotransfer) domain-containing protein